MLYKHTNPADYTYTRTRGWDITMRDKRIVRGPREPFLNLQRAIILLTDHFSTGRWNIVDNLSRSQYL